MFRSLRTLGLSLIAVVACSALAISDASAQQGVLTSDGPVTLDLTGTAGEVSEGITTFGERIECPGTTYTGHKYNVTPHESIPTGTSTITVTPQFAKCSFSMAPYAMTLVMNGCDYVFHIGGTVSTGTYSLLADIACGAGKAIEVGIFSGQAENITLCRWLVHSQSGLSGLTITTSEGAGDLGIVGAMKGIHVEALGAFCSETSTAGEFHMDLTVKGKAVNGAPTAIAISD